jgi:hypothetical protein
MDRNQAIPKKNASCFYIFYGMFTDISISATKAYTYLTSVEFQILLSCHTSEKDEPNGGFVALFQAPLLVLS